MIISDDLLRIVLAQGTVNYLQCQFFFEANAEKCKHIWQKKIAVHYFTFNVLTTKDWGFWIQFEVDCGNDISFWISMFTSYRHLNEVELCVYTYTHMSHTHTQIYTYQK